MNSKVDLHMHSRASDGSDWIPGLLRKIQKLGIRTFQRRTADGKNSS